jgi:hypothetical protein
VRYAPDVPQLREDAAPGAVCRVCHLAPTGDLVRRKDSRVEDITLAFTGNRRSFRDLSRRKLARWHSRSGRSRNRAVLTLRTGRPQLLRQCLHPRSGQVCNLSVLGKRNSRQECWASAPLLVKHCGEPTSIRIEAPMRRPIRSGRRRHFVVTQYRDCRDLFAKGDFDSVSDERSHLMSFSAFSQAVDIRL